MAGFKLPTEDIEFNGIDNSDEMRVQGNTGLPELWRACR